MTRNVLGTLATYSTGYDDVRHRTSTLFAILEVARCHVTAVCKPRHQRQGVHAFLEQVDVPIPIVSYT